LKRAACDQSAEGWVTSLMFWPPALQKPQPASPRSSPNS